jgi:hypothetical protein
MMQLIKMSYDALKMTYVQLCMGHQLAPSVGQRWKGDQIAMNDRVLVQVVQNVENLLSFGEVLLYVEETDQGWRQCGLWVCRLAVALELLC